MVAMAVMAARLHLLLNVSETRRGVKWFWPQVVVPFPSGAKALINFAARRKSCPVTKRPTP